MLFSVGFLVLEILVISTSGKICETDTCKKLAGELKAMIDTKVDPCEDFSSHVCGNMNKIHSIPPGETTFNAFVNIETEIINEMKEMLEHQPLSNSKLIQTKAAIFYKSCLNMKDRNKETKQTILNVVKDLCKSKNYEDNLINLLKSGMGSRFLSLGVDQNPIDPQMNILMVWKPSFILSEGTLQSDQSDTGKEQISNYVKYMNQVLDILGIWKNKNHTINEIVKLHVRLAKGLPSIADQSDPNKYNNQLTIKELQAKYPEIQWLHLINKAIADSGKSLKNNSTILVFSLSYIELVNKVLNEYKNDPKNKEILQKDLEWAVINHAVPMGSEPLIAAKNQFISESLGVMGIQELWKTCIEYTSKSLSEIMGNMYVKAKFHSSQKKDIEFMIENIQMALKSVIENVTWMDSTTKNLALIKLKAITNKIGYPESILNDKNINEKYSRIAMKEDKFLENYINYQKFSFADKMKILGEIIKPDLWNMGPQEVNAYYNPTSNEIVFPAAILRYPFYDIGLPISFNYGGTGTVIGHEILHGFDTDGSKFDAKGMLREWWSKSSRDEYLSKTKCIVEQYGQYSIYNVSLPSEQTLGEDIADNAGMRMAYIALNSGDKREKLTLPGLNYTSDQLFFIGEAMLWCSIITKNAILDKMKGDVHTIWKFRINGPVSNMPEFSKTFNCSRDKKMNRHKKCLVW